MAIDNHAIENLADYLDQQACVAFIGAGFSELASAPSSQDLKAAFARCLGMSDEKCATLPLSVVAQYVVNSAPAYARGRQLLAETLEPMFRHLSPSEAHLEVPNLPFSVIYTTNYDTLIEDAYRNVARDLEPIRHQRLGLSMNLREPTVVMRNSDILRRAEGIRIIKLHGCVSAMYDQHDRWGHVPFVMTLDDYAVYETDRELLFTLLTSQLSQYHFLFLGYSLRDENFQQVYKRVAKYLGGRTPPSYAIIKTMDEWEKKGWEAIGIQPVETEDVSVFLRSVRRSLRVRRFGRDTTRQSPIWSFVKNYIPTAGDTAYFGLAERYSRARMLYDRGDYLGVKKLLEECRAVCRAQLDEFPFLGIAVTRTLCNTYRKLNEFERAIRETESYEASCMTLIGLLSSRYRSDCLQVRAMTYRQVGRFDEALRCLKEVIELKKKLTAVFEDEMLYVADAMTIVAEVYLDMVDLEHDCARIEEMLGQARQYCSASEASYGEAIGELDVHYKGRYYGTVAMLMAREAILGKPVNWDEARRHASRSYSPKEVRKPYGIVAGKYNLAVVEIAYAMSSACSDAASAAKRAEGILKECRDQQHVQVGDRYELPKILKALCLAIERRGGKAAGVAGHLDRMCRDANIASNRINVFSPLT